MKFMNTLQLKEKQLEAAGINDGVVRFSVGLEHVEDIIEDLKKTFPTHTN